MKGESVTLRPLEKGDLEQSVRWINDPEVARYLGKMGFPISRTQEDKWFGELTSDKSRCVMAIEADGKHIGNIGIENMDRKNNMADLGILIGEKEFWGKGYGTDAVKTMLRFVFRELNFHRIYLTVFDYNKRAIRCYEKCGFKKEVVMRHAYFAEGKYHDMFIMGILSEEFV